MKIPVGALMRTGLYLFNPHTWKILTQVAKELVNSYQTYLWVWKYQRTLVMTVGFSAAGKSTLVNGNHDLRQFFRIQGDAVHDLLNARFIFLQDDKATTSPGFWPRHILTHIVRQKTLKKSCQRGIPITLDSCNLNWIERQILLHYPNIAGYRIIMIHVDCSERELLRRIEEKEKKNEAARMPRTWLKLYRNVQQPLFDRPTVRECDQLVHFWSGQQHPSEVSSWISWIKKANQFD